jgi:outer membrane lipoprotein-sorting protein
LLVIGTLVLAINLSLGVVRAQTVAKPFTADAKLLTRIEAYLNGISTMQSKFLQVSSTGELAWGNFYMRRPGRLRIEYDPPSPVLIISDGHRLIYFDKELKTANVAPIEDTLASFLVRDPVRFSGDVKVAGLTQVKGIVRVTLARSGEPEGGILTLVFSNNPLRLRQWVVADAFGTSTRLSLVEPIFGIQLNDTLFEAEEPEEAGDN